MAEKTYVRTATVTQQNPIVDSSGRPTPAFMRLINGNNSNLEQAVNALAALPLIQQALSDAQQAAQDAQGAADQAQTAADAAQAQAEANKREAALTGSYIDPSSVITSDSTTITISAHTRYYADNTSAPVDGGTAPATSPGDVDYISYLDPTREGGSVSYIVSTTQPVQTGDTHVVGAVMIPTPEQGTVDGGDGPAPPGKVLPRAIENV